MSEAAVQELLTPLSLKEKEASMTRSYIKVNHILYEFHFRFYEP